MTNDTQDVTVENQNPEIESEAAAAPEVANKDQSEEAELEENEGADNEEELTLEQQLERERKERASAEKKVKRQKAALSDYHRRYEDALRQMQQVKPVEKQPDLQEPKIEDFDTVAEHENALKDYYRKQGLKEAQDKLMQEQRQQQMQQAQAQRNEIFQKSKQIAIQKYPDFVRAESEVDDFLEQAVKGGDIASLSIIAEQVYDDPDTIGDVVYYFGANNGERLDELEVISKLPPRKAAIELYKLQQRLKGAPPQAKPKQQLPHPAKRVNATGNAQKDLSKGSVLKNLGLK